jgi:hypothetical protein
VQPVSQLFCAIPGSGKVAGLVQASVTLTKNESTVVSSGLDVNSRIPQHETMLKTGANPDRVDFGELQSRIAAQFTRGQVLGGGDLLGQPICLTY